MAAIITNADTPWMCLKHPDKDIFYWVHSKCACSFYKQVLRTLHWTDCSTRDIAWGQSKVFSHIRDPRQKHRAGVIQYFYHNRCSSILEQNFNDDAFWTMLGRVSYLDWHSLTVWEHLGSKMNQVHWIPLDVEGVDHLEESLDFIGYIDDRDQLRKIPKANVSHGFKKRCVDRLTKIEPEPLIIKYLEKDQQLYDKVSKTTPFEPSQYKQRLEELVANGMTQQSAELLLDQQVADGTYLSWQ